MSKVYSIDNTKENSVREYCPFDTNDFEIKNGYSTYNEVLNILREAFKIADITKIFGK